MQVSEVLREAARRLPWRRTLHGRSVYICHTLWSLCGVDSLAEKFLIRLGMPTDGSGFEIDDEPQVCAQRQRKAWLLFAADLWDEGVR